MNSPAEYFDLGSFQSWNLIENGEVNKEGLDAYLDSFSSELKVQKLDRITLSFAQVCDIPKLVVNDFTGLSKGDAIGMLEINIQSKKIGTQSVFAYMIDYLSSNGINVGLAFGGISAAESDWDFGFSVLKTVAGCPCNRKGGEIKHVRSEGGTDPKSLAKSLVAWAKSLKISHLDFDVESAAFAKNDAKSLASFFSTLHTEMKGDPVTLTVMSDSNTYGLEGAIFGPLFSQGKLQTMFDGLNLMTYNGQYYLNAGQTPTASWDLFLWLHQIEKNTGLSCKDAGTYMNVGFNARIDYTSTASSGGPLPYSKMPAGLSSGCAAAYIYSQLITSLKAKEPNIGSGTPFFWDSNADYNVSKANDFACTFFKNTNNFERDFFEYK